MDLNWLKNILEHILKILIYFYCQSFFGNMQGFLL